MFQHITIAARQLITQKLDAIPDIESENWNNLQDRIVREVMKECDNDSVFGWYDDFTITNIYNAIFYDRYCS